MEDGLEINRGVKVNTVLRVNYIRLFAVFPVFIGLMIMIRRNSFINVFSSCSFLAELHPRAKRARGRSPIAKEMW